VVDAVAKAMATFTPAREALTSVRAVPTCLVQLDHALRVGGWPIERIAGVHGPTHEGKSQFVLLLVKSFIDAGGVAHYRDAEQTTDGDWGRKLLGDVFDSSRFSARRESIYEEVVDEVRAFVEAGGRLFDTGHIPGSLVVIDSLRKLVPRGLFEKVTKGGDGIDGASGRAEQIKARFNAAWLDELVPLAARGKAAIVFVLREYEDSNADAWARKFGTDYKVSGGKAVQFDSSLLIRVTRAAYVKDGSGENARVVGERHRLTLRKSKVASKDGKVSLAYFHSSNGALVPVGHDRARDVLDLAERFEIVEKRGATIAWKKRTIGRSTSAAVVALAGDAGMLEELEREVRAKFAAVAPIEYDEATGEIP
jgi:recombination protein RecA